MVNKNIFEKLEGVISAITKGNYGATKHIEHLLDKNKNPEELANFAESLNLMTVKLEIKELAYENTITELKIKNTKLKESIEKNALFSTIFTSLFISTSIYVFLLIFIKSSNLGLEYLPRFVEIIFFTTTIIIIHKSKLPLGRFGATFKGYKGAIIYLIPGTFIICSLLLAIKMYLINFKGLNEPLFIMKNFNFELLLYIGVVLIQEFFTRGVFQTSIEFVMIGKNKKFWSILTTSCIFGIAHIHLSPIFAFFTLGLGIYWGFLFFKERTIIGVCISHFLIGAFAYVLGLFDLLVN